MFSPEITAQLDYYVYRLIDPRNGETFYIGKGKGNRVFAHASGDIAEEDEVSEKLRRVRDIRVSGFDVAHVIHRHGLDNKTAYEVEAALMDAYPGVANIAGGHYSSERGAMHANEIIQEYGAQIADFRHPMLAITINRSASEKSVYEAVRYAWKLDLKRAAKAHYVLAVLNGLIVGVFVATEWLEATPENFPGTQAPQPSRRGCLAPLYLNRIF